MQLSWEVVSGVFIVRFSEYRMAAEHRQRLEQEAGGSRQQWDWLDRRNKAADFPTDFGLVSIAQNATEVTKVRATSRALALQIRHLLISDAATPLNRNIQHVCCNDTLLHNRRVPNPGN